MLVVVAVTCEVVAVVVANGVVTGSCRTGCGAVNRGDKSCSTVASQANIPENACSYESVLSIKNGWLRSNECTPTKNVGNKVRASSLGIVGARMFKNTFVLSGVGGVLVLETGNNCATSPTDNRTASFA